MRRGAAMLPRADQQPLDRFLVLAVGAGVADAHREAVALLDGLA